jgi:hypothetical protein
MGPVVPEFVLVGNGYNHENQVDYVDPYFRVDTKPEK